jgi:hypothetical protein
MDFRIADTFTDSLAKLTGEEQKAAKMAAFDVQLNPAHPGLQSHKLDKPKTLIFGQSLSAGTFVSSCIVPAPACCCAMCITMTKPIRGQNTDAWRRTRRPARDSW